jgi:hypothetical protein
MQKISSFLTNLLEIIDFPGYTYLNLWSLSLLIVCLWVCIETKAIPNAVAAIFSSIVLAYSANSIGRQYLNKSNNDSIKEKKSNDNNPGSSN